MAAARSQQQQLWRLIAAFVLLTTVSSSFTCAKIVEYNFDVSSHVINRLCDNNVITAVNGSMPGPTINVREGDTLVVNVFNNSPYNLTIHWHGIFQKLTPWADGPEYVTQCPITPGNTYSYRFNITQQEGTLWWHAHSSLMRETVHGALIIRPPHGRSYPFPKPHREFPILLGEYWKANIVDLDQQSLFTGAQFSKSDAFTMNGLPGSLYPCSTNQMHKIKVVHGKTYLLRIINTALSNNLFFKIAKHNFTVVAIDASYTTPYVTDVVVIGSAQTVDVLLTANQPPAMYYMAAHVYKATVAGDFDNTTTTGILEYHKAKKTIPLEMPLLPAFNDTPTAHKFYTSLTGLVSAPFYGEVPREVDEQMFVTIGLSLAACGGPGNASCPGPLGQRVAGSMNNASFVLPSKTTMLEAFYNRNTTGVYTNDFPNQPPLKFNYTDGSNILNPDLVMTSKSTKVKSLKFNSTVQVVLQNTALVTVDNHPMHLHGFNFYVLAQGFGNFDPTTDSRKFNLINPQVRNTIAVPVAGWAVIRFRVDNPGIWYFHCHLDPHSHTGLGFAFAVENGPTLATTLPPPPPDLPKC